MSEPQVAASGHLLEPEQLQARLNDTGQGILLVQVTSAEVFVQAHIAGATLVTPAELVCGIPPATGKLPALADLEQLFNRIGYQPHKSVVVYDDEGGGWAGRLAWTLDVIGHADWQYLNGGLHAWHHAGLPLQQGDGGAGNANHNPLALQIDKQPIAEIEDVLQTLDDPNAVVWDVRSAEEYQGLRAAAARSGHIPGAVNLDWLLLQDADAQYRITDSVVERVRALGIMDKAVITHCQTHHRSGLSYMLGRILGMDIRAYHGSWSEWGNREDTPIEV
ncbi:MAG: rhodanese-like domain-containing protein [Pseudomonadota bacterium]